MFFVLFLILKLCYEYDIINLNYDFIIWINLVYG